MPQTAKSLVKPQAALGTARITLMAGAVLAILALAACEVAPAPDGRFVSRSNTPVYPITDTTFEVGLRPGQPFRAFWCSAADYARKTQGADWNDRIYVARGLDRGRISGAPDAVEFSLEPVAQTGSPTFLSTFKAFEVGRSLSVSSANAECSRSFTDAIEL